MNRQRRKWEIFLSKLNPFVEKRDPKGKKAQDVENYAKKKSSRKDSRKSKDSKSRFRDILPSKYFLNV